MNDINKTIETLEYYNRWRRDDTGELDMPAPKESGIAIDDACEMLKQMNKMKEWIDIAAVKCHNQKSMGMYISGIRRSVLKRLEEVTNG